VRSPVSQANGTATDRHRDGVAFGSRPSGAETGETRNGGDGGEGAGCEQRTVKLTGFDSSLNSVGIENPRCKRMASRKMSSGRHGWNPPDGRNHSQHTAGLPSSGGMELSGQRTSAGSTRPRQPQRPSIQCCCSAGRAAPRHQSSVTGGEVQCALCSAAPQPELGPTTNKLQVPGGGQHLKNPHPLPLSSPSSLRLVPRLHPLASTLSCAAPDSTPSVMWLLAL